MLLDDPYSKGSGANADDIQSETVNEHDNHGFAPGIIELNHVVRIRGCSEQRRAQPHRRFSRSRLGGQVQLCCGIPRNEQQFGRHENSADPQCTRARKVAGI
eukprot:5644114-Prymnesium_polylepis.1